MNLILGFFFGLLRFKVSCEGIRWWWCAYRMKESTRKHRHMWVESRSVQLPVAMAHNKRRHGRSAQPLLES
jgi:hypothetical protein